MTKRKGPRRDYVSLKTKLAATIVHHLKHFDEEGNLVPLVSYEDAKKMTEDQVLSLVHFDHGFQHALGGEATHWNLTPRPILEHREKTAKHDRPAISKAKRLESNTESHRQRMLAKSGQVSLDLRAESVDKPKPKRSWPKGRKLQGRSFNRGK